MAIKKIKLPDNTTVDINDSRLPAVTATDNGKVLSVSGGIWSANSKPSYTLDEVADGTTRKLANYQPLDADLTAIAGLTGTSGILKKTAADTWALDTSTFYTSANSNSATVNWTCLGLTAGANGRSLLSQSSLNLRNVSGQTANAAGIKYHMSGNEALILATGYSNASMMFCPGVALDNAGVSSTAMMTINSTGVGIGTSSPTYKIHFEENSDTTWTPNIYLKGARSSVTMLPGIGAGIRINSDRNVWNYWLLDCKSSSATVLYVRADGRVGVMTDSPSEALHVVGNIIASGTITPGSDSRIKDKQKEITVEQAFVVLENLNPKSWTWNEDAGENLVGKKAAGLVAQEVKDVLPDAVTISETDKIKDFHALNYNTVQGYEIAAIKGLIEEVKSLKAEIAELKKQIK